MMKYEFCREAPDAVDGRAERQAGAARAEGEARQRADGRKIFSSSSNLFTFFLNRGA